MPNSEKKQFKSRNHLIIFTDEGTQFDFCHRTHVPVDQRRLTEDVCDDDLCKGYCAIEGFPPGTNKCIYGDSCPYDSPLVCKCA